ncbi:MAG: transposase [Rhodopirellula sp.]|nr:transposase [Rhodopirellula sp.]
MKAAIGKEKAKSTSSPKVDTNQSRGNAVRHGLTASTLLPDVLQNEFVDSIAKELRYEWNPQTPTEEYLVREAARHQAVLDKVESMENAVLRRGARAALLLNDGNGESELRDVALAGAATSDAIQRLTRYRRTHERAVLRSLDALRHLREGRMAASDDRPPQDPVLSESDCETWLAQRLQTQFQCRKCDGRAATHLANAKALQCRSCRTQFGLRSGTVMAGSKASLQMWFCAIRAVVEDREISVKSLAKVMGVSRVATARSMRQRILQAMESASTSKLLADLNCDEVWNSLLGKVSQS